MSHIHVTAVWADQSDPDDGDEHCVTRVHDRVAVSREGEWVESTGDDAWPALVAACALAAPRPEVTVTGAMAGDQPAEGCIQVVRGDYYQYQIETVRLCDDTCRVPVSPQPLYAPMPA